MQQGVFGVTLPKLIRLRRILFGDYRGLLPLAPALVLAPIGLALLWIPNGWFRLAARDETHALAIAPLANRRGRAAVVAAMIAIYYVLLNASYAYWEGGWSYGPRHASPAIPFLCIGLAVLWTASPRPIRWLLAALSAYGVAVTLVAVSTMPLPPANLLHPVDELLWPAFRDGDLALNTQTFASGGVDAISVRTASRKPPSISA